MTATPNALPSLALAVLAACSLASAHVLAADVTATCFAENPLEAHAWLRRNGYNQVTQVTTSADGVHFTAQPAISPEPYLRVFQHGGEYYGVVRLGNLAHSVDPLKPFESGPNPFRDTPYSNQVRHCGEQGIAAAPDVEIGKP